jgi:Trypsin
MGWGSIGGTEKSNVMQSANVPIVGNTACRNSWAALNVEIRDSMICAGDGSAAQCTVRLFTFHYLLITCTLKSIIE